MNFCYSATILTSAEAAWDCPHDDDDHYYLLHEVQSLTREKKWFFELLQLQLQSFLCNFWVFAIFVCAELRNFFLQLWWEKKHPLLETINQGEDGSRKLSRSWCKINPRWIQASVKVSIIKFLEKTCCCGSSGRAKALDQVKWEIWVWFFSKLFY